jgi:phosphoribosylpyrophosphate synthetase
MLSYVDPLKGIRTMIAHYPLQTMDLHASQIQGFFDVPVDK